MDYRKINRVIGFVIFGLCSAIYLYTMQPTLSFWDCGEFIATAFTVSIPHPPGAPLWTLVGKIATIFPFGSNPAVKMNALAALCSGVTVALLYLVIAAVIRNWRGFPKTSWDAVMVFGAAAIGALSYGFSDAFWFNALESEVYSMGTMLIGVCMWLLMYWWENADNKGSEKILLLTSFVIGLSLGIHLLVVQMVLVAGMLYYFRRYEYSKKTFFTALIVTCIAFLVVYPGIVIWYPTWLGGSIKLLKIDNSSVVTVFAILIAAALLFGVIWGVRNKKRNIAMAFSAIFLILLGYSIYTTVILRARVDNLPVNENEPRDLPSLVSYLGREQYGDAPFWPRRYSNEPMHKRTFTNYTSDIDFLWRYQINHMFNRYLGWQYIGRAGYNQDMGIDWSKFYGIPFLIGLFGLFYHFRKDWKLGLSFLWMFTLMGVLTALFQRQQDPQPRERDYFYVGAFFVYSMWIGIGVMGMLELIKETIKSSQAMKTAGVMVLLLSFIFVPGNMFRINYHYQSRHGNYVPFDYAYNLLQSVDKDGILFTNGDNDTFPLWYLQAAEGYRTDVRVINLSLLNTDWYIKQMKNSMPYGSLKVPVNMTDEQISQIQPVQWGDYKMMSVSVPPDAYPDSVKTNSDITDKITWKMPYTFTSGNIKAVKVQDLMVLEIIKSNNWKRPLFFSTSVSDENYIGLDEYLVSEGLAKRLVPFKSPSPTQFRVDEKKMNDNFITPPAGYSKSPRNGYFFRGFNDPDIFFDQTVTNIVQSYRSQYLSFAYYYVNNDDNGNAVKVLDKMETLFPRNIVTMDYRIEYDVAMLYNKLDEKNKFNELVAEVEKGALEQMKKTPNDISSYWNPYKILIDLYEAHGDYGKAIDVLGQLDRISPNNQDIQQKIEALKLKQQGR